MNTNQLVIIGVLGLGAWYMVQQQRQQQALMMAQMQAMRSQQARPPGGFLSRLGGVIDTTIGLVS